jgi:hypothetical protein
MTKSPGRRDCQRARKATDSQARKSRLAEIAREVARIEEAKAEEQAPRAQREAVLDASGAVIREAIAVPDRKRGYRRADPLWNTAGVTMEHLAAVRSYASDYEIGIEGATAASGTREAVSGAVGVGISELRLIAATRYREASTAMGINRQMVQWMGLHRWSMATCIKTRHCRREQAYDQLMAGLEALVGFYMPRKVKKRAVVPVTEVVDETVEDVPQARLGRFARV